MSQVITNAFEQYWQSSLAAEQPVVLDEFILADIPNLDITSPIDPDTGLPPESQIVHRQNVDQRGRINNNAVAYTIVMDTTVGDFSFNAMYLRNKANGVIGMIVYKGRETKLKTDQTTGQTGNSLVKSMLMGYDQAAEATLTNVDAGTWQIDYAARLRGQDEDLRQLASQLYGHHTFIGDGFKVVQLDGGHQVTQGVAIVGGLRIELKQPQVIYPGTKPICVWVDVHRSGSLLSEHQNHFTIITSVADLTDHVDSNGYPHYVAKLATVLADGSIEDGRGSAGGGSGGAGSIPDTFALWKRSIAEAGYDLIGKFGTKLTIEEANQAVLSKDGKAVYVWTGELPKEVSEDEVNEGINNGLWRDVADDLLRSQLSSPGGAARIGDQDGGTVQEKLNGLVASSITDNTSLFRYKIVKRLAAIPPLMEQIVAAEGYQYLYPQGFCYGKNGDIWINMSSNGGIATWATKYNAAGDCVASFNAITGTSETIHFYSDAGVDYIVVGGKGKLKFFDVTSLPSGSSVQTPVKTQTPDVNFAGCGFGKGRMLLDEQKTALGTVVNRDRLFVWNMDSAKREQSITLPLSIAGAASGTPYQDITHKTQGYAAAPEGLYLSHGKNATPTDTAASFATGISLMNWQGNAEKTALITAKSFADFLVSQGTTTPTRIENEGVTIGADGFPHLLQNYLKSSNPAAKTEGIAICSVGDPVGSVNLSSGAVAPLTGTTYGVSQGPAGNILVNPFTGETMDTLAKIFDYMVATNREEYHFYTTNTVVLDLDGVVFPTSSMVRILNPNNFTFFYEVINTKTRSMFYSLIPYSKNYCSWSGVGSAGDVTNCITGDATPKSITGTGNTINGHLGGNKRISGDGNTDIGQGAGRGATTSNGQSNLGRNAGWKQIDGSDNNFDLTTCIGQDSRVSGPNQVQLGGTGTTPYAYAALQIRSDERDKAEWNEIPGDLAVAFVRGLKSGLYKLDLRDDYFEEYAEQDGLDDEGKPVFVTKLRAINKDGSKRRKRWHAGYLSQQVKRLMDELGIDFGMYQDHLVNGGCDVKTLAYEQSIPFLSKALDAAFEKIEVIENKLSQLECK